MGKRAVVVTILNALVVERLDGDYAEYACGWLINHLGLRVMLCPRDGLAVWLASSETLAEYLLPS